jgi:glyoxylase-like metal-dependent hydrolase (beta-lactamase superfamily II)
MRIFAILFVLSAACQPMPAHEVSTFLRERGPSFATWDDVFAHPSDVTLTAFNTGQVFTGPSILIDAGDVHTPEKDKHDQWVPSLAYWLHHPSQGDVLLDSGVAGTDCAYGVKPFYWVPCRETKNARDRLRAHGVSQLRYVILSHFHGDHSGGLATLSEAFRPTVVTTPKEWAAVSSSLRELAGYTNKSVNAQYPVALLPMDSAADMPLVGKALDVFGDGALWAIATPGHTDGNLSMLINARSGPVLLTFDATHLCAGFEHAIAPGAAADKKEAVKSIERLQRLKARYPQIKVVCGHEPEQWAGVDEKAIAPSGPAP